MNILITDILIIKISFIDIHIYYHNCNINYIFNPVKQILMIICINIQCKI